jgi:hypothetical protein
MDSSNMLVRSETLGPYKVCVNRFWGAYFIPCKDPEANITDKEVSSFELIEDFPKVPADLFQKIVSFYMHFCHTKNTEVSVVLFRDNETGTKWKACVPKQSVTAASVRAKFNEMVDIETGEKYSWPDTPEGWAHAGSSHSHGSMSMDSFSSTDDANELGVPGLHFLISHIQGDVFKLTSSVVQQKMRFLVPSSSVIDIAESPNKSYRLTVKHSVLPEVLAMVDTGLEYSSLYGKTFTGKKFSSSTYNPTFFSNYSGYTPPDLEEYRQAGFQNTAYKERLLSRFRDLVDELFIEGGTYEELEAIMFESLESSVDITGSAELSPYSDDLTWIQ